VNWIMVGAVNFQTVINR